MKPSRKGYQQSSPDKNRPFNLIPSGSITMTGVPHPVFGVDNLGTAALMLPGMEYRFPGQQVLEIPLKGSQQLQQGGQTFDTPAGYRPSTAGQRSNWNRFLEYLERSGLSGSTTLDSREKNHWAEQLNAYNKANPDSQVPADFVPVAQYENYLIRRMGRFPGLSDKEASYAFNALPETYRKAALSGVDSWVGSVTSREYYPRFRRAVTVKRNGVPTTNNYDFNTNFEDYIRSQEDPALLERYAVQSSRQFGGPAADPDRFAVFLAGQHPGLQDFFRQKKVTSKTNTAFTSPEQPAQAASWAPGGGGNGAGDTTFRDPDPGAASMAMAGMSFLGSALEAKDRNRFKEWWMQRGMTDATAPVMPGNRGGYTVNEGFFRPDQYTPVQFGAIPYAQQGGYFDSPRDFVPGAFNVPQLEEIAEKTESTAPVGKGAKEAYTYYIREKGLAPHIAAGIVGNLYQESGLQPGAQEKGNTGNGRGIAQWDVRDRWQGLVQWAQKNKRDPFDRKTQLDYVLVEPGESDRVLRKLQHTSSPQEAAMVFGKTYERPNEKSARWDRRASVANSLFNGEYKQGGEYAVSAKELALILAAGGEVEYV